MDGPSAPRPMSSMNSFELVPMLPVKSLAPAVDYYRRLGFTVVLRRDDWGWARLALGPVEIMLDQSIHLHAGIPRTGVLYLYPPDLDGFHRSVRDNGVPVPDIGETFYGMREFRFEDPDGNRWWVGQEPRAG